MENLGNIISKLQDAGLEEVAEETVLLGWRQGRLIEVTILDRGAESAERWSMSARVLEESETPGGQPGNLHSNTLDDLVHLVSGFNWDGIP